MPVNNIENCFLYSSKEHNGIISGGNFDSMKAYPVSLHIGSQSALVHVKHSFSKVIDQVTCMEVSFTDSSLWY